MTIKEEIKKLVRAGELGDALNLAKNSVSGDDSQKTIQLLWDDYWNNVSGRNDDSLEPNFTQREFGRIKIAFLRFIIRYYKDDFTLKDSFLRYLYRGETYIFFEKIQNYGLGGTYFRSLKNDFEKGLIKDIRVLEEYIESHLPNIKTNYIE